MSEALKGFLEKALRGRFCDPVTFLTESDNLARLYALGVNKYELADGETVIGYYIVIVDWTGCEINTAPKRYFQTENGLFTRGENCCTTDSSFHETYAIVAPAKRVMFPLECMRDPQEISSGYKVLDASVEDILRYARKTLEYNYTHYRKVMFQLRVKQCMHNLARAKLNDQDAGKDTIMNDNIGLDVAIKLQHARWLMPVTADMRTVLESVITPKPGFEKLFISLEDAAVMTAPRSFKEATVTFDATSVAAPIKMAVSSAAPALPSFDDFGDFGDMPPMPAALPSFDDFGDMPPMPAAMPSIQLPVQFTAVGAGEYRPPKRANGQSDVLFNAGPAPADIVSQVLAYGESTGDYYVSECCALLYLEIKKYGPIPK